MPRPKRIIIPGCCYHVMMRGVGGQPVFLDDEDRIKMCLFIQYAAQTCDILVHGFCLMNNHIHLVVQPKGDNLSEGIHRLTFRYAQYFNKKTGRQGYLFQGRYRSIAVQQGPYLRRLIRYVHLNPERAGLGLAADYQWSSHQAYLGKTCFTWLTKDLVLPLFGENVEDRVLHFKNFVEADDNDIQAELEAIHDAMAIGAYGGEIFMEDFKKAFPNQIKPAFTIEQVVRKVTEFMDIDAAAICSSSRNQDVANARAVFVRVIKALRWLTNQQLATALNRDETGIWRLEQKVNQSPELSGQAEKILRLLRDSQVQTVNQELLATLVT